MNAPRAILFDWDNTLVDTWPVIHAALNETMRAMGEAEWTLQHVRSNVKRSMRDSFPELFGDRWEDAARTYQQSYRSMHLQQLQPLEGALEVLQFLRTQKTFVGIVSNKRGPTLRDEVKHLGWNGYFDVETGSGDAQCDKPHPSMVQHALTGSGIAPAADVLFVGDTTIDLECAKNTGCTPILYGDVPAGEGKYEGFAFAHHARDHAGLLHFLMQRFGA